MRSHVKVSSAVADAGRLGFMYGCSSEKELSEEYFNKVGSYWLGSFRGQYIYHLLIPPFSISRNEGHLGCRTAGMLNTILKEDYQYKGHSNKVLSQFFRQF